jgi:hypothetical protein
LAANSGKLGNLSQKWYSDTAAMQQIVASLGPFVAALSCGQRIALRYLALKPSEAQNVLGLGLRETIFNCGAVSKFAAVEP